jgi:hypothetical protein
MKRLIASSLVTLMAAAALATTPALGESATKTELVDLDGKSVDRMQLRHDFEAPWVVDTQNILWRDTHRDYYLVTLKEACDQLKVRRRFHVYPSVTWELRANRAYEVRPWAGPHCGIAKIAQIDDARASALREASLRRAW